MDKKDLAKIALIAMTSGLCLTTQLTAKEYLGMATPSADTMDLDDDADMNNNDRASCSSRSGCRGNNGCKGNSGCRGNNSCKSNGGSKNQSTPRRTRTRDPEDCPSCGKKSERMNSYGAVKETKESTIAKNMVSKRKNLLNG